MISAVGVALAFASVLIAVGYWGRRNAASLVPTSMSATGRGSKERAIRRGAVFCLVGGVLFVVLAVFEFVIWLTRG